MVIIMLALMTKIKLVFLQKTPNKRPFSLCRKKRRKMKFQSLKEEQMKDRKRE